MDRLSAQLATKVVCVSPSVYKRSLEDKLNMGSKQILLSKGTCNGIDIERFNRDKLDYSRIERLKADLGLNRYNFIIGFTGRMVRDKGIIELVNAFKCLQGNHPNIALLLVGMLEKRDALPENIVNEIKRNSSIIYTGYVENAMIEYYYAMMNLFVLPSYREGFPTSVLEASAMELPVITTKVTGCIDSIIEEKTGIYVEHDSGSLAIAIENFYHDEMLCHEYGRNGRKFVVDNFEQHIIWKEIEKLYLEV
ncbi:glycosyltransferase [uncultured Bacteroides sp.]